LGDYVHWHLKGQKEKVEKFNNRWFGPYRVQYRLSNNTALLVTVVYFRPNPFIVNINKLKLYKFFEDHQLVTIATKILPKGLDNQQKEDNITNDRAKEQTTQTIGL
jgi:hypothetical protein